MGQGSYRVPMPQTEMYQKSRTPRDDIVAKFGESTVSRAEVSTILNIMVVTGMVKPDEFIEILVQQCRRIEEERALAARVEPD